LTLEFNRDEDVVKLKEQLIKKGFLVGAIRRPTVKRPILRVIPNIGVNSTTFERFAKSLKELGVD
jgi:8-amino-7-oxononanoate synthase